MAGNRTGGSRHRARQLLFGLVLLGALATVLALLAPGLVTGLRTPDGSLVVRPECAVQTPDGEVGLDRDAAKRATTAVALLARGKAAPDTTGIHPAVLQRLAEGPSEDAGPVLACRGSAASDLQEQQAGAGGLHRAPRSCARRWPGCSASKA